MGDDSRKVCSECQGAMTEIVLMDRFHPRSSYSQQVQYRLPDDKISFWTGKYPTAGNVLAFLCSDCGRIALYGQEPNP